MEAHTDMVYFRTNRILLMAKGSKVTPCFSVNRRSQANMVCNAHTGSLGSQLMAAADISMLTQMHVSLLTVTNRNLVLFSAQVQVL